MKQVFFFAVLLLLTGFVYGQGVVVNADGTHSVVVGNIAVNSDGTHSVIVGPVMVNPDGTHSHIAGSAVISPNGTTGTLLMPPGTSNDYSLFGHWKSSRKRKISLKEEKEQRNTGKQRKLDERHILNVETFRWLKKVAATHY